MPSIKTGLIRDKIPIALFDKAGTKACLLTMTRGNNLIIVVKERIVKKGATTSELGKILLSLSDTDVVNVETEQERVARQGSGNAAAATTIADPLDTMEREMVVGCFGSLTAAAPPTGGHPAGVDDLALDTYFLSFLPAKSKQAVVKYLRFRIDATAPPIVTGPRNDPPPAATRREEPIAPLAQDASGEHTPASPSAGASTSPEGPRGAMRDLHKYLINKVYPTGPRHLTVFISPVSGKGAAQKMWEKTALPILRCSRHTVTPVITQYARHAEEMTYDAELTAKDVYVVIGGDGMIHEVTNAVMRRKMDKGLESVPEGFLVGMLPAGSGCALAKTLDCMTPLEATMALVHLTSVTIDLMRMQFFDTTKFEAAVDASGKKLKGKDAKESEVAVKIDMPDRFAFLSASFAITNEIDKGSEKYRWMGNARFTFYTLKILTGAIPTYRCEVRYVPWVDSDPNSPLPDGKLIKTEDSSPVPTYPSCSFIDGKCDPCNTAVEKREPSPSRPDFGGVEGFAEPDWVKVDADAFAFLMVCNIPYIAQDMLAAPFAHMSDGAVELVYIEPKKDPKTGKNLPIDKGAFIKLFLDIENGKHVNSPDVRYIKAKAVEIIPHDGITMSDGEVVPSPEVPLAAMRVTPVHRAINFVRGPLKPQE